MKSDTVKAVSNTNGCLVLKAYFMLLCIDIKLKLQGFARVWNWLTARNSPHAIIEFQNERELIASVCHTVQGAARFYIRRIDCLEKSMAVYRLLRIRGIVVQLCIGVQKYPFYAHAWVEYQGEVVNDSQEVKCRYNLLMKG